MPTPYKQSYDFENKVRDVTGTFETLRTKKPTLLGMIGFNAPILSTKHEWNERQITEFTATVGSFDTDGDGTGINLSTTVGIMEGDILEFNDAGASQTEVCRVTSVDTGTDLTLERQFGGTTGVTLVVGWNVTILSRPRGESSTATFSENGMPTTVHNFTQIIDRAVQVSKTSELIPHYGVGSVLNLSIGDKLDEMYDEINRQLIRGVKIERVDSATKGMAGGLREFVDGGNNISVGGAISKTALNNVMEDILEDGGSPGQYVLLCNINQAKKISAFNTAGTNPLVHIPQGSTTTGGFISTFVADLPVQNGFTAQIVIDQNVPKDKIYVLDMTRIRGGWLRPITDTNAQTSESDDFWARRLLGEFTFEIKEGKWAHGVLSGLTV